MTDKELNDVWLSLKLSDDNMSTFNGVVMEFAPNFTPFKGKERRPGGRLCVLRIHSVAKSLTLKLV